MPTDIPHQPDARPAVPQVESEDLVDLNLDESLEGDLQSVADEVASEYRTQMVPEMDLPDLPQPAADQDARVDLESALTEAELDHVEPVRDLVKDVLFGILAVA